MISFLIKFEDLTMGVEMFNKLKEALSTTPNKIESNNSTEEEKKYTNIWSIDRNDNDSIMINFGEKIEGKNIVIDMDTIEGLPEKVEYINNTKSGDEPEESNIVTEPESHEINANESAEKIEKVNETIEKTLEQEEIKEPNVE